MTRKPDDGKRVFARVSPETHARIERLRDEYPVVGGRRVSTSAVLRAFVIDGDSLMEPSLRAEAATLARERRCSLAEAWREIVVAGIAALRREAR